MLSEDLHTSMLGLTSNRAMKSFWRKRIIRYRLTIYSHIHPMIPRLNHELMDLGSRTSRVQASECVHVTKLGTLTRAHGKAKHFWVLQIILIFIRVC
jgi:hypothetical protein